MNNDRENNQQLDLSSPILSARLARLAVFGTLGVILFGSFYGRSMERQYHSLIVFLPYLGLFLAAIPILLLVRLRPRLGNLLRYNALPAAASTIAILVTMAICCETLITFHIERVHFIKYSCLSFFLFYSQRRGAVLTKNTAAFVMAAAIGACEETLQNFIPERVFDYWDLANNCVAAAFGTAYVQVVRLWQKLLDEPQAITVAES